MCFCIYIIRKFVYSVRYVYKNMVEIRKKMNENAKGPRHQ